MRIWASVLAVLLLLAYGGAGVVTWAAGSAEVGHAVVAATTLVAAENAYARTQGGLFESRLTCLARPQLCRHHYAGAAFLSDTDLQAVMRDDRYFSPGPTAGEAAIAAAGASPTSVKTFAYVANAPQHARWWMYYTLGGLPRPLCVDSAGGHVYLDGMPIVSNLQGHCPASSK